MLFRSKAMFTNAVPTDPYRGAGRPESTYQMERVVDHAAAELGIDPLELRRRNLILREDLPYKTGMGIVLDSGDFATVLAQALELPELYGFPARPAHADKHGPPARLGPRSHFNSS